MIIVQKCIKYIISLNKITNDTRIKEKQYKFIYINLFQTKETTSLHAKVRLCTSNVTLLDAAVAEASCTATALLIYFAFVLQVSCPTFFNKLSCWCIRVCVYASQLFMVGCSPPTYGVDLGQIFTSKKLQEFSRSQVASKSIQ